MITSVTLNPAIDRTLIVEGLCVNGINRVKSVQVDAGGKGINASKVIQFLGERTLCLGIVGGVSGRELVSMLDARGLEHDFIECDEATRINTKVVDRQSQSCTDLNEPGPFVTPCVLDQLIKKVYQHAMQSEILLLSGNAQESIPTSVYAELIEKVRSTPCKVILDSSGCFLKEGIHAKPWLIKPNISELSEIVGRDLTSHAEIITESKKIIQQGTTAVCVSMGSDGLLYVDDNRVLHAIPPKVRLQSTVGAGDAVVGSLAVSLLRGLSPEEALCDACAISAASVTLPGTGVPDREFIQAIKKDVTVTLIA